MTKIDARDRLIKAAIDLFFRKGYPNSTIRDIGVKANVNTSAIYHYFKNKEEMLSEIIQIATNDLLKILTDIIEEVDDPIECLQKMIKAHMIEWCLKRKKESKIIVMDDAWLTKQRKNENSVSQRKVYALYRDKLSEMQEKGLMIDVDLTVLCFSIFGIINQSIRWFREKGPLSKDEVAQNVIDFLFSGILKENST